MSSEQPLNVQPSSVEFDYFGDWLSMETFLGEYGQHGFSKFVREMKYANINPDAPTLLTFNVYRGEDGLLLGVVVNYMDNGTRRPFTAMVHPEHQRKGIMTMMANRIIQEFEDEYQRPFSYVDSWGSVETTESAAAFVNKYALNNPRETQE